MGPKAKEVTVDGTEERRMTGNGFRNGHTRVPTLEPSVDVINHHPGLRGSDALTSDPENYRSRNINGGQVRIRQQNNLPTLSNVPKGLAVGGVQQAIWLDPYDGTSNLSLFADICFELSNVPGREGMPYSLRTCTDTR